MLPDVEAPSSTASTASAASSENGLGRLPIANASEVAFRTIRQAIIDGRLGAGERLREVALARQMGISATPVREALARLQQEGLVEFEPRRGAVVPRLEPKDVIEVYELRELLEGHAARRAARRLAAQQPLPELERLELLVAEGERLIRGARAADYNRLDVEFHQTLLDLAGNRRMRRIFDAVHAQVQAVRLRAIRLPGRPAKSQVEHARLVAAIRSGDARAAEAEARRHVASVKDEVLAALAADTPPAAASVDASRPLPRSLLRSAPGAPHPDGGRSAAGQRKAHPPARTAH